MKLQGMEGLLAFLGYLREKGIKYRIDQQADDSLEVSFALVGFRFEVAFYVDHIAFSYFTGHEDVELDESKLFTLIERNAD
jgi:hypothetical protein